MGYHLTILRTSGKKQNPISKDEFVRACGQIPSLSLSDDQSFAEFKKDGELFARLMWFDGTVWTKVPEPEVLSVMLELADRLDARVRGDENETYSSVDSAYFHPDDAEEIAAANAESERQSRKSKFWRIFWIIVRVILLAICISHLILKCQREGL